MASLNYSVSVGGISSSRTISGDDKIETDVTLPAGKAVTGWTKTDSNTAAATLPGGHGYTNGKFDVYWSGGRRYGVDGTISTNALSLDGGIGDAFPASSTTGVVVTKQVVTNKTIDGDALSILAVNYEQADTSDLGCRVTFFDDVDAGGSEVGSGHDLDRNTPSICDVDAGATNLYTGSVIRSLVASNGSSTTAAVLKLRGIQDVTQ